MDELPEIFPCPWCGGGEVRVEALHDGRYFTMCLTCYASGPLRQGEDAAAWAIHQHNGMSLAVRVLREFTVERKDLWLVADKMIQQWLAKKGS
jgi:hypothetical protein